MGLGTPELIMLLLMGSFLGLIPAIWGYYAGSQRSIGGGVGLILGLVFSYLGVLVVYLTSKKFDPTFYNFPNRSSADELQKYKNLLDSGAITEQEYNIQKARILNGY
ncbi:MAG: SHOCT domain-containing protein [Sphingobacteriaceae bacterium]|nr:MAG: SHOCT domain-containing protein [Sphingobacteriaceae bacterium]